MSEDQTKTTEDQKQSADDAKQATADPKQSTTASTDDSHPAVHKKAEPLDKTIEQQVEQDVAQAEDEIEKLNPFEGIRAEDQNTNKHNLVVLDHPYTIEACNNVPHDRAFSSALAESIIKKLEARGETVDLIDLHADNYDPVMTKEELIEWRMSRPMNAQVQDYQARMKKADKIFLVFPIWWEQMPAMMKGFADKVYAKNILYEQKGLIYKSKLKPGVELFVYTVQGAPKPFYRLLFDNLFVRIVNSAISFRSGIKRFHHKGYTNVGKQSLAKRQKMLRDVKVD